MNKNFYNQMKERQIDWRVDNNFAGGGHFRKKEYEHILRDKRLNFYDEIWNEIEKYLWKNNAQAHTGINNLLSSWALCANLYWPFRNEKGKELLGSFLSEVLKISIKVVSLDLEYAEKKGTGLSPYELLNEDKEGKRGAKQTSPDIGIQFIYDDNKQGVALIECKFTEKSFYKCSAYSSRKTRELDPNPHPEWCEDFKKIITSDFDRCHLHKSWKRKYWNYLKDALGGNSIEGVCPMSIGYYQLFRQQALARALEMENKKYEKVYSCVAYDERNDKIKYFLDTWMGLFPKLESRFQVFTHQQWFNYVATNGHNGDWAEWLDYIRSRYSF